MISPSTKSVSGSTKPVSKWRLKRTLSRQTDYRPIELDDLRYLWAAYKKGCFVWFADRDLNPEQFKQQFTEFVMSRAHSAWTLIAHTKNGYIPVGIVICTLGEGGWHLVVSAIVWFPWASKRNMIESMVGFFSRARKEFRFIGYALPEHKRMYEVCCAHGLGQRIGTSMNVLPGHPVAIFETRHRDKGE